MLGTGMGKGTHLQDIVVWEEVTLIYYISYLQKQARDWKPSECWIS